MAKGLEAAKRVL
jgi:hypothetical protein